MWGPLLLICIELTSPKQSSAVPVWIFSPQSHSHCVDPTLLEADEQCPAPPIFKM